MPPDRTALVVKATGRNCCMGDSKQMTSRRKFVRTQLALTERVRQLRREAIGDRPLTPDDGFDFYADQSDDITIARLRDELAALERPPLTVGELRSALDGLDAATPVIVDARLPLADAYPQASDALGRPYGTDPMSESTTGYFVLCTDTDALTSASEEAGRG